MRWPWVHRARLEAANAVATLMSGIVDEERARYAELLKLHNTMKQQGFASPPKSRVIDPDPEAKFVRGLEADHKAQLVKQFMADPAIDEKTATLAAEQAMRGFLDGS